MTITNQNNLAEELGVTRQTIIKWMADGMPYKIIGPMRYEFELDKVKTWLLAYSPKHKEWIESLEKE